MAIPNETKITSHELVEKYVSHIKGKTILITGASMGGLGAAYATSVAAAGPALLILAGRNMEKLRRTADAISEKHPSVSTRMLQIDLGSLVAVRRAADELLSWNDVPAIDVLVNNAGIMAVPYELSVDGYELQFAVNYLGPFLFTNLVMQKLLAADFPRVVNVSSGGHVLGSLRHFDLNFHVSCTFPVLSPVVNCPTR
jgi:NAD(P)-dependent dehydrogenase (short-subunit alcohol dehydrogenase family)